MYKRQRTVGFSFLKAGCERRSSAVVIIVNVLPEPWVCQTLSLIHI